MRSARLFVPCVLGSVLGCSAPAVDLPEWDPLDVEDLRAQIEAPTANFADDPTVDMLREELTEPSPEKDIDAAMQGVRDALANQSTGDPPDELDGLGIGSGTAVFLKVACPGPDVQDPDRTFDYGQVRVDSPRLNAEVLSNFGVEGDLLLTFVDCSAAGVTYLGEAPAWYTTGEAPELAVGFSLDVVEEGSDTRVPFDAEAIFELTRTSYVQPSAGGGTYTLELDVAAGTTALRAADGVILCDSTTADCSGP